MEKLENHCSTFNEKLEKNKQALNEHRDEVFNAIDDFINTLEQAFNQEKTNLLAAMGDIGHELSLIANRVKNVEVWNHESSTYHVQVSEKLESLLDFQVTLDQKLESRLTFLGNYFETKLNDLQQVIAKCKLNSSMMHRNVSPNTRRNNSPKVLTDKEITRNKYIAYRKKMDDARRSARELQLVRRSNK